MQSKTYTLSVRARSILKTAEIIAVKWARILKDRMRLEAQRVTGQMNRAVSGSRGTLIINCKMGQVLRLLFPAQQLSFVKCVSNSAQSVAEEEAASSF